jgi:hypothetical protein
MFDINQPFVTQEQKFKYWEESKAEIKRLKSALSEIEKCEPVLKVTSNGSQLSLTKPNGDYWDMSKHIGELFYTSPQQREWKDVPYERRRELYKSIAKGNIDGFADLLSAELKQLNTKG